MLQSLEEIAYGFPVCLLHNSKLLLLIIAILCLQEFFKMATVSKSKKSNPSTLLQGQMDDYITAFNSRNRKSARISSIGDKKVPQ
jgi:Na+/H+-dicarboxylate symporter